MSDQFELTFLIAEYEAQHARVQACIGAVSQAVALFVGGVTLLATAVAGAAAVLFPSQTQLGLAVLSCAFFFTAVGGALTLFASYRARIQQTDSEQILSRLRRYFLTTWPHVGIYIIGSIHDDWPTPYTHPWRSYTVFGWLCLIAFSSVAFGAGTTLGIRVVTSTATVSVVAGVASAILVFTTLFSWMWSRLRSKRQRYVACFPRVIDL